MKRAKRWICLVLCFSLLWNSTSYLAEAQGTDNLEIKKEDSDTIIDNDGQDEKDDNVDGLNEKEPGSNEGISLLTGEEQEEEKTQEETKSQQEIKSQEKAEPQLKTKAQEEIDPVDVLDDDSSEETPTDRIVDKDIIINLTTTVDKVNKSISLQWEKLENYEGLEAVIYKSIDRSDENPIVIDIKDFVKDEPVEDSAVTEMESSDETSDSSTKVQEVVLNKDIVKEAFLDGTIYYIDLKPFNEVEVEVDDESEDEVTDDGNVAPVSEETDEQDEPAVIKEYGNSLSTAVVFLAKPAITVSAGDTVCTVSWKAVPGASKYQVVDVGTGKVIQTVTGTSVKIAGLKNSVRYTYKICAIAELKAVKDAKNILTYVSDYSNPVAGTTKIVAPATVSGLSLTPYNLGAILKWNRVSGATQYEIYRYDTKTKKWKSIQKTTATSYKNTGLTYNRKYTYKVRAIRVAGGVTAIGAFSSTQAITAKKYLTCEVHPIYYKARVRSRTPLFISSSGSAKAGHIKAGTKVTVLNRANGTYGRCYVKIKGKYYWLARKRLSFYGGSYTSKDFTTAVKEEFVNSKGYSSKTKYLIWISSYTQKVNLFTGSKGKWKLYKTYKCATGKYSTTTPQGVYTIKKKKKNSGGRTYWKYLSCFYGGTALHTLLYRGGRIVDRRLGKPVSNGCVRMNPSHAKWFYNTIPKGTTVVSY